MSPNLPHAARRLGVALIASLLLPTGNALAQGTSDGTASDQLLVERMDDGFTLSIENRFSEFDGRYGNFVGGRLGWLTDTLFIGAGGYWLTNADRGQEMSYAGFIAEWTFAAPSDRTRFTLRGLVGGGDARLGVDVVVPDRGHFGQRGFEGGTQTRRILAGETYFVAEPELGMSLGLTRWLRLNAGVGYRFVAGAGSLNDRLDGVSGRVAVQLGP